MNKLKALGIRFADNDFSNEVRTFLKLIAEEMVDNDNPTLTKEKISFLFNKIVPGIYLLQKRTEDYIDWDPEGYFILKIKNIYFNEEVDDFIVENKSWDNSEFHFVYFSDYYNFNVNTI